MIKKIDEVSVSNKQWETDSEFNREEKEKWPPFMANDASEVENPSVVTYVR